MQMYILSNLQIHNNTNINLNNNYYYIMLTVKLYGCHL